MLWLILIAIAIAALIGANGDWNDDHH